MVRQDGLHTLHLIVYPQFGFDLPILRMKVFIKNNKFTQCTIDTSPVHWDTSFPGPSVESINRLKRNLSIAYTTHHNMWEEQINSSLYVNVNSPTLVESDAFINYACLSPDSI